MFNSIILKDFCNSEITNLDYSFFGKKDIHAFEISMDYFLCMQISYSHANLESHEPYHRLINRFPLISNFSNIPLKVTSFCILHYYVQTFILHERIIILDDMRMTL